MGSTYIFWDIARDRKKRSSTFHQILLAMTCFDVVSSIGWGLTTLPIPRYDPFGDPTNIFGARGNDHTCTLQGFLVQMGFTSVLYNITLSGYYYLVIALGWKESRLSKMRIWLHVPAVVGTAISLAGIPWYEIDIWGCYIQPPPLAETYWAIAIFAMTPVMLTLVVATGFMGTIVLSVRAKAKKAAKWRQPGDKKKSKSSELEKQVLWQAIFYLGAFYISFPILILSNAIADSRRYWLFVLATSIAPLQGFNNCLVYIRPRVLRYLRNKQKARAESKKRKRPKTESTAETGNGTVPKQNGPYSSGRQVHKPYPDRGDPTNPPPYEAGDTHSQEETKRNDRDGTPEDIHETGKIDFSEQTPPPPPPPLPSSSSSSSSRHRRTSWSGSFRKSISGPFVKSPSVMDLFRKTPPAPMRKANADDDAELQMQESELFDDGDFEDDNDDFYSDEKDFAMDDYRQGRNGSIPEYAFTDVQQRFHQNDGVSEMLYPNVDNDKDETEHQASQTNKKDTDSSSNTDGDDNVNDDKGRDVAADDDGQDDI